MANDEDFNAELWKFKRLKRKKPDWCPTREESTVIRIMKNII